MWQETLAGTCVTVVTNTEEVFVGKVVDLRHCHEAERFEVPFLLIRLTHASGPYAAGEIVALNVLLIISIGPIIL